MKTIVAFGCLGVASILTPNVLTGCSSAAGGLSPLNERVESTSEALSTPSDTPLGPSGVFEPSIAVNPTNPSNIAASLSYSMVVSTDNGATFSSAQSMSTPSGENNDGDANPAFDSTGRLFACHIGVNSANNSDILVSEINPTTGVEISLNNVTASAGIPLQGHDRDCIAADHHASSPFRDRLYVAWTNRANNTEVVAYSSDHGSTWKLAQASGASANVVSLSSEGTVWQNNIAVAANGDVYLAYHSQTGFVTTNAPDGISGGVIVLRSTNGGQNFNQRTLAYARGAADPPWNVQNKASRLIPKNVDLTIGSVTPFIVPDPGNSSNVFVVAADDINNSDASNPPDVNVYIAKSTNSGVGFGAPIRVDSGPAGTQQFFPTAAFDEKTQCLTVMWWDNRKGVLDSDGTDYKLDTFIRTSTDDGATFGAETQINVNPLDGDSNAPLWTGPPNTWRIGEYNGIALVNGIAHADWTETDSSSNQQIVYNKARACSDPTEPPTTGVVAAVQQSTNVTSTFAFAGNGALYTRSVSHASGQAIWTGPTAITAASTAPAGAAVAAVATVLGTTPTGDVFYIGNDGKVQYLDETNDGAWAFQGDIPNQSSVTFPKGGNLAVLWVSGQLGVWAIDTSGRMQALWWNPVLGWLGPAALTGTSYAPQGASLAVITRTTGETDVFAIGSSGGLEYMAYNGTAWSGPFPLTLGGFAPAGGGVAAAKDVHGYTNVLTVGNDGNLATKWDCTAAWCGTTALTTGGPATPGAYVAAFNLNNSALFTFFVDKSGNVDELSNAGLGWSSTNVLSNSVPSGGALAAATEASSQLDLFFIQNSFGLSDVNYTGSWSATNLLP